MDGLVVEELVAEGNWWLKEAKGKLMVEEELRGKGKLMAKLAKG